MGTEYALLHDATHEAFDLGKGSWYRWRPTDEGLPASHEAVVAHLTEWLGDVAWRPAQGTEAWVQDVATKIWSFLRSHPGSRVVGDGDVGTDSDYWDTEPWPEVKGFTFYRVVGTRYAEDGS